MKIEAPASAAKISQFIKTTEKRYIEALEDFKARLLTAKRTIPDLGCIYSIYSRGDKQLGSELKHPRKIRLKVNKHCADRKEKNYDLFGMPDIVGATVTVPFPDDINLVNREIDRWIDEKLAFAVYIDKDNAKKNSTRKLQTIYGNVKAQDGYYACHYYLRTKNNARAPIVEIQIKTLLHDAWGLLTHDLTYKPSGKLDEAFKEHFAVLGDQLSKIDSQADIFRKSIYKSTKVRESKKRAVQVATIQSTLSQFAKKNRKFSTLLTKILRHATLDNRLDCSTIELANYMHKAVWFFDNNSQAAACLLLCLLAVMTGDRVAKLQALEYIDIWSMDAQEPQEAIKAKSFSHLAHFAFSDTATAIEAVEEALDEITKIEKDKLTDDEKLTLIKRENSLYSSLTYYHSEIIGSDDGVKRSSIEAAQNYALKSIQKLADLGLIDKVLPTIAENITAMLDRITTGASDSTLYHSTDNLIFVLIQTADALDKLDEARALLRQLRMALPPDLGSLPSLLTEFHLYCARQRLTELELQGVDG